MRYLQISPMDILIFKGIFSLFSGFLLFLFLIINKIHLIFDIFEKYYVLFLFSGILFTIIGMIQIFIWNFKNKKPYVIEEEKPLIIKSTFSIYLMSGVFFILIGFLGLFFFKFQKIIRFFSLTLSISGIVLLILGFNLFVKEVFLKTFKEFKYTQETKKNQGIQQH